MINPEDFMDNMYCRGLNIQNKLLEIINYIKGLI